MVEVLKYLDPLWYFNLKAGENSNFYFPDYNKLSPEDKSLIDYDSGYKALSMADAGFQAFKRGVLVTDVSAAYDDSAIKTIPISDLYRFVRKYYHTGWVFYFFFIRLMHLKNPFIEIPAFLKSLQVKRTALYSKVSKKSPRNTALPDKAKISVVLPTLNRYEHLKNILDDLSKQSIPPFEIIIPDQSDPHDAGFYESFRHLPLRVIYQEKKGQWLARNESIRLSAGDFILFADDDSRVKPDWIEQHLRALIFFHADISAGVSIPENTVAERDKTFFHWAEEFDSGNAMVRRDVFKNIGLFDRAFDRHRMGDTEFGLRAYLSGFKSVSNPLAQRIHVKVKQGGMRYWGSREAFKPIAFFGPRPDPGVLYLYQRYFEKKYLLSFLIVRILLSYMPSKIRKKMGYIIAGFIGFVIFSPWWIPQILINLGKARRIQPDIPKI